MTQELGRINRPSAAQYQGLRKLLLVPLVYGPSDDQEGAAVLQNYWEQVQTQVAALETALGSLQHIYHESLTVGGDEGLEQLGATDQRSHRFIRDKCEAGAALEATEDLDALLETLDLQRCMMIPLASPAVAARLQEWYAESNRRRYEHIASRIDGTLGGRRGWLADDQRPPPGAVPWRHRGILRRAARLGRISPVDAKLAGPPAERSTARRFQSR